MKYNEVKKELLSNPKTWLVTGCAGDIAKCYANPSYAKEVLGWEAIKTLDEMCEDIWRWQSNNPDGYKGNKW